MWFKPLTCRVIAEVGQTHDGSLGTAHAYIDAVARIGADAIKFQTHLADAESTPGEPWRVQFSRQDATRYDYWKRMEFLPEHWAGLAEHCRERGLIFLSSAFSMQAVELLDRLEVAAWKVGAGEITNLPMIERMASTRRPVLLSSGLASWADLDAAVSVIRDNGAALGIFQCTTAYPCPPEKLGLNVLSDIRKRYDCPTGLSDHSGTIYAGLAAASLGASMIEVHVAFTKECFGPDVPASVTTSELAQLVEGVRFIERALQNPVDKEMAATELDPLRKIFGKSVVAARDIAAGAVLTAADVTLKKPGTGIPASRLPDVLKWRSKRRILRNTLLSEDDLEQIEAS
jgi:N-acetylneuraminate synthase